MSAQSGFLNCFLKFIQGERGEKLQSEMVRGRPASSRFTITMDERNAILTASSKRLNQEKKKREPVPAKQVRKRGRPKLSTSKQASQSTRSKGSVSEADSESGGNEASDSQLEKRERLCLKVDSNDGDESSSGEQKSDEQNSGEQKSELNQEKKKREPVPAKQVRKRGRPKLSTSKQASRSTRSKGSVSEADSESGGNEASDSQLEKRERLCLKVDSNDGDESSSGEQKSDEQNSGEQKSDEQNSGEQNSGEQKSDEQNSGEQKSDEQNSGEQKSDEQKSDEQNSGEQNASVQNSGEHNASVQKSEEEEGPKVNIEHQGDESGGENGKLLRDRRITRNSVESSNNTVSSSDTAETESAACESSVIPNGEENKNEGKEADSVACTPVPEKKKRGKKRKNDPEDGLPRRTLSSRKAKQKARISYAESGDEEEILGLDDNSDSDDPVWVPDDKKGSSDEGSNFSWSKYEKLHLKAKKSCANTPVNQSKVKVEERGVKQNPQENTGNTNSGAVVGSVKGYQASQPTPATPASNGTGILNVKDNVKNVTASSNPVKLQSVVKTDPSNPALIVMPFQSGTFIAQKTDLEEKEEPPIWRVDGKSLLQKYEPFKAENGKTWYRNVSTYSGWGPKSHLQYQELPVKFIKQNRVETIVEIIQAELPINEDKLCEKIMKDYEKHAYAYEVFVQTLLSQALDSNFLSEIIAEKDDYFLNCVEEIDKVSGEKKTRLKEACQWTKKLTESLATWPTMTLSQSELLPRSQCSVCYAQQAVTHVKMDGNPYKFSTLEYEPPSEESFKSKEFIVCAKCSEILTLFHKIVHLKYHTYENGVKLVSDKKALDPSKNNTDILHDILADGPRVKKEFQEISRMWAQSEIKSRRVKKVDEKKVITII